MKLQDTRKQDVVFPTLVLHSLKDQTLAITYYRIVEQLVPSDMLKFGRNFCNILLESKTPQKHLNIDNV